MPRAFNEQEEKLIRQTLRSVGRELFGSRGISKTSIEEITGPARIAKGSFYKFYSSKETLFFELLEEAQYRIRAPLIAPIQGQASRHDFENRVLGMVRQIQQEPLLNVLRSSADFFLIARKLPPDFLAKHQEADQAFIDRLTEQWNNKTDIPTKDAIGAHLAMLLMIQNNDTLLGDRLYPFAEQALVTSFANCFFD